LLNTSNEALSKKRLSQFLPPPRPWRCSKAAGTTSLHFFLLTKTMRLEGLSRLCRNRRLPFVLFCFSTPNPSCCYTSTAFFSKSSIISISVSRRNNSSFLKNNVGANRHLSSTTMTSFGKWEDGAQDAMAKCILPLSSDSHKGSSGRVGVLGGSARYTGAPFYAAMASLKAGADLSFVFCAQEASLPIKCYSPELMVAPVYNAMEFDELVKDSKEKSPEAE
jgi:hypothetical protein